VDRIGVEVERRRTPLEGAKGKVKFEAFGEEMLEKKVSLSGNSGRIYLPPDWVGHQSKLSGSTDSLNERGVRWVETQS